MPRSERSDDEQSSDDSVEIPDPGPAPMPGGPLSLDALPPEVCARVVAHVCHGVRNKQALLLAELTPELREAVLTALKHAYEPLQLSPQLHERWRAVFRGELEEVLLLEHDEEGPGLIQTGLGKLKVARIDVTTELLGLLKCAPVLRELHLNGVKKEHMGLLYELLGSLSQLELVWMCCKAETPQECPFGPEGPHGDPGEALAEVCRRIKQLTIRCDCLVEHPYSRLLERLPALRRVGVETTSHLHGEEAYMMLRSMEHVYVQQVLQPYEVAMRIGAPVAALVSDAPLMPAELKALAHMCPQLQHLTSFVVVGAETVLPDMTRMLVGLETLELIWKASDEVEAGDPDEYFEVQDGYMLEAMRHAKALRNLKLDSVVVGTQEMVGIMRVCGGQLQQLSVCILCQQEGVVERLLAIVDGAARYCSALENFHLFDGKEAVVEVCRATGEGARREIAAVVKRRAERLKRTAPFVRFSQLESFVQRILEWEGGE